jgi:hypothetical protein
MSPYFYEDIYTITLSKLLLEVYDYFTSSNSASVTFSAPVLA